MNPALPRPLTAERYFTLVDEGLLSEDDRVELLEGVVVAMAPQNPRHAATVHMVADALRDRLGRHVAIRIQVPLIAGTTSVPEPDIAIVPGAHGAYADTHPTTALLVVEVSDSSLGQDRLTKTRIYAAAGIPQCLIVNLRHGQVESYSLPDVSMAVYRTTQVAGRGQHVTLASFPDTQLAVDDLLPR